MNIQDSHSAYNKWQVINGNRLNNQLNLKGYLTIRTYTRNLKTDLPHSLKELIVEDINSQKNIRIIGTSNIDEMIDTLNLVKGKKAQIFEELRKKDFFEAFRYLHKLKFG